MPSTLSFKHLIQGNCTRKKKFGYRDGNPCILLKLNRIFGWEPEPYLEEKNFPNDFPEELRNKFRKNEKDGKKNLVTLKQSSYFLVRLRKVQFMRFVWKNWDSERSRTNCILLY